MNNEFDFLRKLMNIDSYDYALKVFKSLSNEGLEVYVENSKNHFCVLSDESQLEGKSELFIAASDRDYAINLLKTNNLSHGIYEKELRYDGSNLVDEALERAYKKRKRTMIESLIVIVIALIYYIIKCF